MLRRQGNPARSFSAGGRPHRGDPTDQRHPDLLGEARVPRVPRDIQGESLSSRLSRYTLGRGGAERRALGLLQMAVLLAAVVTWEDGGVRVAAPAGLEGLANRWLLHKETDQAELYRSFESRIEGGNLGNTRASAGVLALYPYSFPIYYRSQVMAGAQAQAEQLDSLLWFAGDRDEAVSEQWLTSGHFPYLYHVIGTRMSLATRLPPDKLPSFAGAIELAVTSANDGGADK